MFGELYMWPAEGVIVVATPFTWHNLYTEYWAK